EENINIFYPADIGSLVASLNMMKAELEVVFQNLLLPLGLDFEKIDDSTYVIYRKKNAQPKVLGIYQVKFVNPEILIEILRTSGIEAYTFGGNIYYYTSNKRTQEEILEYLKKIDTFKKSAYLDSTYNIDAPNNNLGNIFILINIKHYAEDEILRYTSSTSPISTLKKLLEFTKDDLGKIEKLKVKEEYFISTLLQETEKYGTTETITDSTKLSKKAENKIFVYSDKIELELVTDLEGSKQGQPNYTLKIKTPEDTINISILEILENNTKSTTDIKSTTSKIQKESKASYITTFGKDIFLITVYAINEDTLNVIQQNYSTDYTNYNEKGKKDEITNYNNKNNSERSIFQLTFSASQTSLQLGTGKLIAKLVFKNNVGNNLPLSDLSEIYIEGNVLDNVSGIISYNVTNQEYAVGISDKLQTSLLNLTPSVLYNISRNKLHLSVLASVDIPIFNFYLTPTIYACTDNLFYYGGSIKFTLGEFKIALGSYLKNSEGWLWAISVDIGN
ncbi:MAG: hypothetical protein ACK4MM_03455, partial [Fervidobacterium sp.]